MKALSWMRWLVPLAGGIPGAYGQSLQLSARVSGSVFFEGEPVYLVVELHNAGPDTVWSFPIDFVYGTIRGSVTRDGERMPELAATADRFYGPNERGVPLGPGESMFASLGLLSRWGYPGDLFRPLFLQTLPPGAYVFTATFVPVPHPGVFNQGLTTGPVRFSVRSRTDAEEGVFRVVQHLGELRLDRTRGAGFLTELIAWCRDRLGVDSTDSFVPHLLKSGVGIAEGMSQRPSQSQTRELLVLQAAVARGQRSSPVGALLLDAGPLRDSTRVLESLASPGDSSLLSAVLESRRRSVKR